MKPEKISPSKYFQSKTIVPVEYRRQTSDYFQRLEMELGRRISKKHGAPVFTKFNAWCHAPTLIYPDFYLKIQLSNKAGGSVFTEMTPSEFDEWLTSIIDWRKKFDKEIQHAIVESLELKRRKHIQTSVGNILGDIDLPTSIIERAIEEKMIEEGESKLNKLSIEELAETFIKMYRRYRETNDPLVRKHLFNQMRSIMPNDIDDLKRFRELVQNGEHPLDLYKDIIQSPYGALTGDAPTFPHSSQDEYIGIDRQTEPTEEQIFQESPLDIDMSLLYPFTTIEASTTYSESTTDEDEKEDE